MKKIQLTVSLLLAVCIVFLSGCTGRIIKEKETTEPQTWVQTVRVTFIEGETLVTVFTKLYANGVCDFNSLMEEAQNGDFSAYPLVSDTSKEGKFFRLEGYLFPDTYEFYKDEDAHSVICRFLDNAEKKITPEMRTRAAELGYSTDEILALASIIQKEGPHETEAPTIASVIYNRLKIDMRLQMDTTILYLSNFVKPFVTEYDEKLGKEYDTYECYGLPAGAICNPGLVCINAALYPSESDYYYFCHDSESNYYYAKDYNTHLENCRIAGCD